MPLIVGTDPAANFFALRCRRKPLAFDVAAGDTNDNNEKSDNNDHNDNGSEVVDTLFSVERVAAALAKSKRGQAPKIAESRGGEEELAPALSVVLKRAEQAREAFTQTMIETTRAGGENDAPPAEPGLLVIGFGVLSLHTEEDVERSENNLRPVPQKFTWRDRLPRHFEARKMNTDLRGLLVRENIDGDEHTYPGPPLLDPPSTFSEDRHTHNTGGALESSLQVHYFEEGEWALTTLKDLVEDADKRTRRPELVLALLAKLHQERILLQGERANASETGYPRAFPSHHPGLLLGDTLARYAFAVADAAAALAQHSLGLPAWEPHEIVKGHKLQNWKRQWDIDMRRESTRIHSVVPGRCQIRRDLTLLSDAFRARRAPPAFFPLEVHVDVVCDGCSVVPIRGPRFWCRTCAEFDLCESCFGTVEHDPSHELVRVPLHVFAGFRCDVCDVFPMVGARYHCRECDDFDICLECARKTAHSWHRFQLFAPPHKPANPESLQLATEWFAEQKATHAPDHGDAFAFSFSAPESESRAMRAFGSFSRFSFSQGRERVSAWLGSFWREAREVHQLVRIDSDPLQSLEQFLPAETHLQLAADLMRDPRKDGCAICHSVATDDSTRLFQASRGARAYLPRSMFPVGRVQAEFRTIGPWMVCCIDCFRTTQDASSTDLLPLRVCHACASNPGWESRVEFPRHSPHHLWVAFPSATANPSTELVRSIRSELWNGTAIRHNPEDQKCEHCRRLVLRSETSWVCASCTSDWTFICDTCMFDRPQASPTCSPSHGFLMISHEVDETWFGGTRPQPDIPQRLQGSDDQQDSSAPANDAAVAYSYEADPTLYGGDYESDGEASDEDLYAPYETEEAADRSAGDVGVVESGDASGYCSPERKEDPDLDEYEDEDEDGADSGYHSPDSQRAESGDTGLRRDDVVESGSASGYCSPVRNGDPDLDEYNDGEDSGYHSPENEHQIPEAEYHDREGSDYDSPEDRPAASADDEYRDGSSCSDDDTPPDEDGSSSDSSDTSDSDSVEQFDENDAKYVWNRRFQEALPVGVESVSQRLDTLGSLIQVNASFEQAARKAAMAIVNDLQLPLAYRKLKSVDVGGIAGGEVRTTVLVLLCCVELA
jgi:Zinc finger, ZZ type